MQDPFTILAVTDLKLTRKPSEFGQDQFLRYIFGPQFVLRFTVQQTRRFSGVTGVRSPIFSVNTSESGLKEMRSAQ